MCEAGGTRAAVVVVRVCCVFKWGEGKAAVGT